MYQLSHSLGRIVAHAPHACLSRIVRERISAATFACALLLAGSHGLSAHEFKVGDLEIEHPWSREVPTGARVAGGYLSVKNTGGSSDRLISVASDIAAKAEVHQMSVKDGVMTMRQVDGGLEIPAGATVALEAGGYHLMFIDLKKQPKKGESFPATLTFEKAGSVTVDFAVEGLGESGGMNMDSHHVE